jgi:hypothetical protein
MDLLARLARESLGLSCRYEIQQMAGHPVAIFGRELSGASR